LAEKLGGFGSWRPPNNLWRYRSGQPNDDITAIVSKHLKIYGSTLGSREEFRNL